MNIPKVSIIVPCYNQAQYLDEALQSVFNQTYTNWECIIVNDGSSDSTEKIASKWCDSDLRFRYFYKENGGISSARNLALDNVIGDYLQFLDSDDILDKNKLQISLDTLKESSNLNIVISNFRMFTTKVTKSSAPFCDLKYELLNFNSALLKWESVFSIPIHCGFFDIRFFEEFRFSNKLDLREDWIMWLFIFQKVSKVYFIDQTLVYYRLHPKSVTSDEYNLFDSYISAVFCLGGFLKEKDYINYLQSQLQKKHLEIKKMRTTIHNYQNSTTYKVAEKIKTTFLSKYFLKIIKK